VRHRAPRFVVARGGGFRLKHCVDFYQGAFRTLSTLETKLRYTRAPAEQRGQTDQSPRVETPFPRRHPKGIPSPSSPPFSGPVQLCNETSAINTTTQSRVCIVMPSAGGSLRTQPWPAPKFELTLIYCCLEVSKQSRTRQLIPFQMLPLLKLVLLSAQLVRLDRSKSTFAKIAARFVP